MNKFKSHFVFSKQQRNGIFLLLLLIVIFQCVYFFIDFPSEAIAVDDEVFKAYKAEIDSLRMAEAKKKAPKIFPFNPNYITDYKGYALGMSTSEIDKLLAFRAQNKWVNSVKKFQEVTQVSDSLLDTISPYFKFPEWVTNANSQKVSKKTYSNVLKTYAQKVDLNTATPVQLQKVYGIGEKLSKRIVNYRNKVSGFVNTVELLDVYGLTPEVIDNVEKEFAVKTPRAISTVDLNSATREELVAIKHIDYEIAHLILEQRTLRGGLISIGDLMKIEGFPTDKIEIIKLYLRGN